MFGLNKGLNVINFFLITCKKMWKCLLLIFLSIHGSLEEDCGTFVVDDCDRNLCENRAVNGIESPILCQILCSLTEDFTCQSFAYSREHRVCLRTFISVTCYLCHILCP